MVRVRILSDLHYEMLKPDWRDRLPDPGADLLIIAGDYDHARHAVARARRQFPRIPLIMVAGNHEHYGNPLSVADDLDRMRHDAARDRHDNGNVTHVLEDETVELGLAGSTSLRIIGATLWTDFALFGNPGRDIDYAQIEMNDFYRIKNGGRRLKPADTVAWHRASRRYIARQLAIPFAGQTIVVTHHLPSIRSLSEPQRLDRLTPAFASDCTDLLLMGADLWVHGHSHETADYRFGRTRVICNPRGAVGYAGNGITHENKAFDPNLVVELT